jgi:proline dehydrogenase
VSTAADPIEREVRRIGAELAAAFPSAARHPVRALDARAMELASRDSELRAALFRFVDVVPACRSLDDVARHLTGFLEELPEAPPPPAGCGTWPTGSSSVRARKRR